MELLGSLVRIKHEAEILPLVGPYAGREGLVSHAVGGDPLHQSWVVALSRTDEERRTMKANPYGEHCEQACHWIPVHQNYLEVLQRGSEVFDGGEECLLDLQAVTNKVREGTRTKRQRLIPGGVAVVVCFRDLHVEQKRGEQLNQFVPFMENFLQQGVDQGLCPRFKIFIVEQSDDNRKFNRGKLLNIGFQLASDEQFDIVVFHDVDLLPSLELLQYYCQPPLPGRPVHVARVWDRYSEATDYGGGIVTFRVEDFQKLNGYPNNFWGWGAEDDELVQRCKIAWGSNFRMDFPTHGSIQDLEDMNLKEKLAFLKKHKEWKCNLRYELRAECEKNRQQNGLNSLSYLTLQRSCDPRFPHTERIVVDVLLNGDGMHDEWAGLDFLPDHLLQHR